MNKILDTLYHDSTKHYISNPYPKRGDEIEVKIRVKKNDKIDNIFLRHRHLGEDRIIKMKLSYEKNGLQYFTTKVKVYDAIFIYYFNIATKDTIYYYVQNEVLDYRPDNSRLFKIILNYDSPKWMAKSVFYQILPDRFYNSDDSLTIKEGDFTYLDTTPINMKWDEIPYEYEKSKCMDFYGGDLYGVVEKLDYLQELGVNAIYLNPIFTAPTIHKYDALDFFEIDPSLGGEDALIKLSEEMHKRDMKLVLDISINHTSSSSKWFNKDGLFYEKSIGGYNNKDSEYREFFFIEEDGSYLKWAGVDTMPALNYGSEKLRNIIYRDDNSVLKKYLKEPFNIDGWRFDVADVMARNEKFDFYYEVWEEINTEIKKVKPDALIMAEEWQDAHDMYNGKRWDSTMNYFSCEIPIREYAGEKDVFTIRNEDLRKIDYKFNANHLKNRILQFLDKHPSQIQYQMFNLIDSHDTTRLHNNKKVGIDIYKGAVITLFGLPGATNIYYGDEKYLDGRLTSIEGARYPMDWSDELSEDKKEIFELYKTLSHLKTKEDALEFGGFKIVYSKDDIFIFSRFVEDKGYIFAWNKSEKDENINLDLDFLGELNNISKVIGNPEINRTNNNIEIKTNKKESFVIEVS